MDLAKLCVARPHPSAFPVLQKVHSQLDSLPVALLSCLGSLGAEKSWTILLVIVPLDINMSACSTYWKRVQLVASKYYNAHLPMPQPMQEILYILAKLIDAWNPFPTCDCIEVGSKCLEDKWAPEKTPEVLQVKLFWVALKSNRFKSPLGLQSWIWHTKTINAPSIQWPSSCILHHYCSKSVPGTWKQW